MDILLQWLNASGYGVRLGGELRPDPWWMLVTVTLSALIAIGYCVIAVNWYFQTMLARQIESRAALRRLRNICLCCGVCGTTFYLTDVPWGVWRFYDAALAVFAFNTWAYVLRTRGRSLVDERLAQISDLERAATRYREMAELLPHMVWTATADGQVDFSNLRWREYAGADRNWIDALHPDDRSRVLNAWYDAVAAREPVKFEARLGGGRSGGGGGRGAAGVYRAFVVNATPIAAGEAVKWLGACADIEDQKLLAAEKEMQARQRSFFLNALSHDLRAPLHNVLLNAQLLKMSTAGGEPVDAEALAMIMENAVAAGDLVARLLDFAKVGAEEHNIVEHVSIPALLGQIARRFTPPAQQKGLYLRVHGADGADAPAGAAGELSVLTDRQKLERIIANLVDNAIKYTARGGVTLEIVTRGGGGANANVGGGSSGDIVVRIIDTGIGVPRDKVPFLFDEFYQVNNYERDRSKGFGMGLAICRSLARHIHADVRLAATGAAGSCFEIVVGKHVSAAAADRAPHERGNAVAAGAGVSPDRGGRSDGPPSDCPDTPAAGLCGV